MWSPLIETHGNCDLFLPIFSVFVIFHKGSINDRSGHWSSKLLANRFFMCLQISAGVKTQISGGC